MGLKIDFMKSTLVNLSKNILLAMISSILFLSLLEISIRLLVDKSDWYNPSLVDLLVPDNQLGWKYKIGRAHV